MAYLLDSDVLIRAKRDHYRFGTFPCFWDWVRAKSDEGIVRSVVAIQQEVLNGGDELATWIRDLNEMFLAPDEATANAARRLSAWAQGPARIYTPAALAEFFASGDYWLIAHASAHDFTVVTMELPAPLAQRRVKIPDACNGVGVAWVNPFEMLEREGASFV